MTKSRMKNSIVHVNLHHMRFSGFSTTTEEDISEAKIAVWQSLPLCWPLPGDRLSYKLYSVQEQKEDQSFRGLQPLESCTSDLQTFQQANESPKNICSKMIKPRNSMYSQQLTLAPFSPQPNWRMLKSGRNKITKLENKLSSINLKRLFFLSNKSHIKSNHKCRRF